MVGRVTELRPAAAAGHKSPRYTGGSRQEAEPQPGVAACGPPRATRARATPLLAGVDVEAGLEAVHACRVVVEDLALGLLLQVGALHELGDVARVLVARSFV